MIRKGTAMSPKVAQADASTAALLVTSGRTRGLPSTTAIAVSPARIPPVGLVHAATAKGRTRVDVARGTSSRSRRAASTTQGSAAYPHRSAQWPMARRS